MAHHQVDTIASAATLVWMAGHIGIDAYLGSVAEYYNVWHVLRAWAVCLGIAGGDSPMFLYGQDAMGRLALPLATVLVIAETQIVYHLMVYARRQFLLDG